MENNPNSFITEKLNTAHQREKFSCGVSALDNYIQKQATQDERRHLAVTYVLNDNTENRIIGFYTLSSTIIESTCLAKELSKKLPHYPIIPSTLIGRFAIDTAYQKKGFGELLLIDTLRRAYASSQTVASFSVIVDAISNDAVLFYQKYGFINFIGQKNMLYLPMASIKNL